VFVHTICRVHFNSDTNEVSLIQLNKKSIDLPSTTIYCGRHALPTTIQYKIAVIDLVGKCGKQIDGVGYTSAPDTYWVYN